MRVMRRLAMTIILVAGGAMTLAPFHGAARQNPSDPGTLFDKMTVRISARDGAKLYTEIYTPKNVSEPLPIIFERTAS